MALIKCPECGKEVSDRADACPVCGFPISKEQEKGKIKIKLGMFSGIGGNQSVTITANGDTLWSGKSGEVAEFELTKILSIDIIQQKFYFVYTFFEKCDKIFLVFYFCILKLIVRFVYTMADI